MQHDPFRGYLSSSSTVHECNILLGSPVSANPYLYTSFTQHYADQAEKVWSRMIDIDDKRIKLPHDGYVKLYQLRKPRIHGYNVLLIDEAQDITPGEFLFRSKKTFVMYVIIHNWLTT